MANDPVGRIFLLVVIVVFSLVALRPEWAIKILSYGTRDISHVNGSLVRVTRIITGVSALWGAVYLAWWLISNR
jgi:hypothetical protein